MKQVRGLTITIEPLITVIIMRPSTLSLLTDPSVDHFSAGLNRRLLR
jgi:hypothetical protein